MSGRHWMKWSRGALVALACFMALPAGALNVTSGFTGNWFDPAEDGQGLQFEIIEVQGRTEVLVLWFLFDAEGNLLWLFGQAPVEGNTATVPMYQPEGGSFGEPVAQSVLWGEITLVFNSCNSARLDFSAATPGKSEQVGTGFKNLQRLTSIKGSDCTGGASDDLPPRQLPEDILVTLNRTAAAPAGARGTLKLEVRSGRMELELEVRGLDVGVYDLTLDGDSVAQFTVEHDDSGNEGELELQSPAGPSGNLLDFDPRGGMIAVERGGTVYLASDVPDSGSLPGAGNGNPPPFGNSEFEVHLTNAGVYPAGDGKAELEQEPDRVDFKVEIEDVPTGDYRLIVDGVERGTIQVVSVNGRTEGELEFRFPGEAGKITLDFDPLGAPIEIHEGGTLIFSGDLLGGGSGDDNGGDDDGGDDDGGPGGGSGPAGDLEVAIALGPTAAGGNADGKAEYRQQDGETRFKVEIEDVADGDYTLEVGGVPRGVIEVSGSEGELEFRDPPEPGKELLDFDPLGKSVRVLDGGTLILQGTMPAS